MYAAAAGMAAQQDRIDAVSNDIANVNTTGYKRTRVAFRDLVYTEAGLATNPGVRDGSGSAATFMGRGSAQGSLLDSTNPLDVAITGPGFLSVRNAQGQQVLTRDGHLNLDATGRLVTGQGMLMDPPIQVPAGTDPADVKIGADGTVTVGQRTLGKLGVVTVPAEAGLFAQGDNTFVTTAASGAARAAGNATQVVAGKLEGSNADMSDSMTEMIESQRAFEMASKAIQTQDRLAEIGNQVKR
ncbi:MAG: flagellar hook-basal body protein [Solirubrobacteraceae bacterium]|nr:flagellar hook-basal body protein [Solirubrobacteraceae bacterium]